MTGPEILVQISIKSVKMWYAVYNLFTNFNRYGKTK